MNEIVYLSIPEEKHKFMSRTLKSFKTGIRVLKINPLYKQSLIRDIQILESILKINK